MVAVTVVVGIREVDVVEASHILNPHQIIRKESYQIREAERSFPLARRS
ncbi:hypothetical protein MTo_00119 [Microcystis aeruginosa NIES-1211]|jgi:hypothetical protein|nr:hypothetical protein MTo_00119 [Microcystis aeruginosa NIES-1211]